MSCITSAQRRRSSRYARSSLWELCRYMCRPPGRARNCHAICRPFNELDAAWSVCELAKRRSLSFETSHTPASAGHPQTFALASARMKLLHRQAHRTSHTSRLHTTRKSGLGDRALPWHRQCKCTSRSNSGFIYSLRASEHTLAKTEPMLRPSM